jgi:hypothetical protein
MAKVIQFYVSDSLPKNSNYRASKEPGKLIEFSSPKKDQANSAQWPAMYGLYCTIRCKLCEQSNGGHHVNNTGKETGDPDALRFPKERATVFHIVPGM